MMSFDQHDESRPPEADFPPPPPPQPEYTAASTSNSHQMAVTEEERLWAMLAQLLTLVTAFIGPLVIYVIYMNRSRYVAFHALQATLFVVGITVLGFVLSFVAVIASLLCAFFIFLIPPTILLSLAAMVWPIYAAVQAYNGQWYEYPVVGPFARKQVYGQ